MAGSRPRGLQYPDVAYGVCILWHSVRAIFVRAVCKWESCAMTVILLIYRFSCRRSLQVLVTQPTKLSYGPSFLTQLPLS